MTNPILPKRDRGITARVKYGEPMSPEDVDAWLASYVARVVDLVLERPVTDTSATERPVGMGPEQDTPPRRGQ